MRNQDIGFGQAGIKYVVSLFVEGKRSNVPGEAEADIVAPAVGVVAAAAGDPTVAGVVEPTAPPVDTVRTPRSVQSSSARPQRGPTLVALAQVIPPTPAGSHLFMKVKKVPLVILHLKVL